MDDEGRCGRGPNDCLHMCVATSNPHVDHALKRLDLAALPPVVADSDKKDQDLVEAAKAFVAFTNALHEATENRKTAEGASWNKTLAFEVKKDRLRLRWVTPAKDFEHDHRDLHGLFTEWRRRANTAI